jgi:hypothetical protein
VQADLTVDGSSVVVIVTLDDGNMLTSGFDWEAARISHRKRSNSVLR